MSCYHDYGMKYINEGHALYKQACTLMSQGNKLAADNLFKQAYAKFSLAINQPKLSQGYRELCKQRLDSINQVLYPNTPNSSSDHIYQQPQTTQTQNVSVNYPSISPSVHSDQKASKSVLLMQKANEIMEREGAEIDVSKKVAALYEARKILISACEIKDSPLPKEKRRESHELMIEIEELLLLLN